MEECSMCKKEVANYLSIGAKNEIKCFTCAGVTVGMVDNTKPPKQVYIECEKKK